MQEEGSKNWVIAFVLIYLTFFLDNVLLTVLVPIIPDWVRGSSLAEWGARGAADGAPLARVLNATVHRDEIGVGGSQALVGLVLSAKALAQLAVAGPAAAAVCRRGPAAPLRAGTTLLLLAALVFAWSSMRGGGVGAVGAGCGRAAQGAGAALCGVAGLALAQRVVPPRYKDQALGALLGAVALGVLVGYPFGGATYALWSPEVPFLIIAVAILATLAHRLDWQRRPAGRADVRTRSSVRRGGRRRAARHRRHGGARALSAALAHAALPSTALGERRGVRAGQRGVRAGDHLARRRGEAARRRAARARRPARRGGRRAGAAARQLRARAGRAARLPGRWSGRGGRGAGAGAAGRAPRRRAAPRRAAARRRQRRLRTRSYRGRAGVLVVRVREHDARAGRAQPAVRGASVPSAQCTPALQAVGGALWR